MMNVNWLAILVSTVVYMVVGSLWYSPLLFVKPWMKLIGKSKEKQGDMSDLPKLLVVSFIAGLLMAFVLSVTIGFMQATTWADGIRAGFWTWLGFVATYGLVNTLYEGKPLKLFAINTGYYLVSLILMGIIIVWLH